MKVTTETLENRRLRVTVELDEEQTQGALRKAARRISKQFKIPGFRPGKAPYDVILRRFGEDAIRQEIADNLLKQTYENVIKQENITPYAPGQLEETKYNPITYVFTVSQTPVVDLGDYRDYRREPPTVKIHDAELQEALEEIREDHIILEPVERAAEMGDGVVVDVETSTALGEVIGHEIDANLVMSLERPGQLPGLVEAIEGMSPEEKRKVNLTLPDDFHDEKLRGKPVSLLVEVKTVYERAIPDIDDDLARVVGKYENLDELKESLRESLRQDAQEKADTQYINQVLADISEGSTIEFPPEMLQEELDKAVENLEKTIKDQTKLALNDYLRIRDISLEELIEEMKPDVTKRLERSLMLAKLVSQENLTVSPEEIDARIEEVSAQFRSKSDDVRAQFQTGEKREGVRNVLLTEKAIDRIVAIAKGEAPPLEPADGQEQEDNSQAEGETSND